MTHPMLQSNQQISSQETWNMALQWVSTHQKLIRQIASPYIRHMTADKEDLYQEATIAAFKAILTSRKKKKPEQFTPFFRVIFKTCCIKAASGIHTVHCLEDYYLPFPEKQKKTEEPNKSKINQALKTVSKRQREVCLWLLQQPNPVSTPDIAKEFNVSRRHACRLVSNSIQRISGASL
ncbi:sigma-70 family RNA polymerase sigma factor [Myxococcota bacterium]|nr:sigma-70 family RNA polymerase sigma factor [Myxococcota bacterium]MBU1413904.1 sigma-70 family RNA polymerase sigma factor [Myxococcota bacterium]